MYAYEIVISAITMILCGAFTIFCTVVGIPGETCMLHLMWVGVVFMLIMLGAVLYEIYKN